MRAAEAGKPKQHLVLMLSPNGTLPDLFWPDAGGENFELKRILGPLEPFKKNLLTLKGLPNKVRGDGDTWIALREGNALYRADLKSRKLTHIAGAGKSGIGGNGGHAKAAQLAGPKGLTISPDGHVFIADTESHSARVVDTRTGLIDAVCGNGEKGPVKEGAALECQLARPHGVFWDRDGTLYIGDSENHQLLAFTGLK